MPRAMATPIAKVLAIIISFCLRISVTELVDDDGSCEFLQKGETKACQLQFRTARDLSTQLQEASAPPVFMEGIERQIKETRQDNSEKRGRMQKQKHQGEGVGKRKAVVAEDIVQVLAGTDIEFKAGANPFFADFTSNGNTLPQIKMPWGFNDWVPQTNGGVDGGADGGTRGAFWFNDRDSVFQGMRCTHQPSPWLGDYGHFILQPHIDDLPRDLQWSAKSSVFRPYLLNTTLEGIGFEFVPTSHAALLRITFPASAKSAHLSVRVADSKLSIDHGEVIRGNTISNPGDGVPENWAGMYFTVKAVTGTLGKGASAVEDQSYSNGKRGTLHFKTGSGSVLVAVASSFISQEQADLNLEQEVGSKSFQQVLAEGRSEWSRQFSRVQVDALDETQLKVFYTNLWKSLLFPRYLQEVNSDGQEVHRSPYTGEVNKGKLVADSGFWDSYISVYPLQSLFFSDNMGSLIDAWVNSYKSAQWLPQWASPGQRAMMVGTLGDVTLADAIAKSQWGFLSGFDVNKAYEAIRKDAFNISQDPKFGRKGLEDYIEKGYVTADVPESVSITLDYYTSDAAIARAAGILGKYDDEKVLTARSKRYDEIFNKDTQFFQPKDTKGRFWGRVDPGDTSGFTEAGPWQYRFYLPHDVEGLQRLYNGTLCDTIKAMMTADVEAMDSRPPDLKFPETFGLYTHGNQPVHHILYVAKKAGCDSIADKYLRKVMQTLYTTDGWAGDEDNGEMASWYILSALGLYTLEGAKDELVLGSPIIKHAHLQLANNKFLTVATENQASDHAYVQSVTWTPQDGSPHEVTGNVLKFTKLMQGGTLTFTMGPSPKTASS